MEELPVIVSYSNFGYAKFAENLLRTLNKTAPHHRVHFYCLDDEILTHLSALGFATVTFERVEEAVSKAFETYGSASYNKITHTKINILRSALRKFGFIHFVDSDVVCMKEPTAEHYAKYKDYDIVFQYDSGFHSATRMYEHTLHHIWTCMGNMSLRNTPGTAFILDKVSEYQVRYPTKNDQECLYSFFDENGIKDIRNVKEARLFTYEVAEYTNGFWLNRNIGTLEATYFFHANHVTGSAQKIKLLQKAGQWNL